MDFWRFYDYIVNTVHAYMIDRDRCLVNAQTLTYKQFTDEQLIAIRNSAYAWADAINAELGDRAAERVEADEDDDQPRALGYADDHEDTGRYQGGYRTFSDGSYREDFGSDR